MDNKCDAHDQELKNIRSEFGNFKKDVYDKLDELFEEVRKPVFTEKEKATLIISLVVYLVFSINYISGNNFRSIENTKAIEKSVAKDDKMMDLLMTIKEDVASLKPKE